MDKNFNNQNEENGNTEEGRSTPFYNQGSSPWSKVSLILVIVVVISLATCVVSLLYAWRIGETLKSYKEELDKISQQLYTLSAANLQNKVSKLSDDLTNLSKDLYDFRKELYSYLEIDAFTIPGMIMLDSDGFQIVDETFKVAIDSFKPSEGGALITGYILNTDGCIYENVKFTISSYTDFLFGPQKEFTISRIDPGHAAKFSVFVPNLGKNEKIVKMYRSSNFIIRFSYQ